MNRSSAPGSSSTVNFFGDFAMGRPVDLEKMRFDDLDNLEHMPELAAALGNMVVAWARAETVLASAYAFVLGVHYNRIVEAYYVIPTFEARTKAFIALLPEWPVDDEKRASIKEAVERLSKLAATRNGWVHGLWVSETKSDAPYVMNVRKPYGERHKTVKLHDVDNHSSMVRKRTRELALLIDMKILPLRPSPRKSP